MKYEIANTRRRSRNNGINFCTYYVIVNTETKEIIYDNDAKVGIVHNDSEQRLRETCDKLNSGELYTKIEDGREQIVWPRDIIKDQAKEIKAGDKIEIEPLDTLPNFDREIIVDGINEIGFHYGTTETSDGKIYPFWAIKSFKKATA